MSYGNYLRGPVDTLTGARVTVEYEHHEIHCGSHYFNSGQWSGLPNATTASLLIRSPAGKKQHLVYQVKTDLGCTFSLREALTTTAITTTASVFPSYNNDRGSIKTASASVYDCLTSTVITVVTASTSLLKTEQVGANKESGALDRTRELILDTSTDYLITMKTLAASNTVDWFLSWYEE